MQLQFIILKVLSRRSLLLDWAASVPRGESSDFVVASMVSPRDLHLEYVASHERISTGIKRLDSMLGGRGSYS
jgi:hypothetical protein